MVLTLLRGLNGKFRHMMTILKMHRPFPTFAEARTHLLLEELEIDARPPSPPVALVTTPQQPAASGPPAPSNAPRQGNQMAPQRPAGAPSGNAGQRSNGRRRGRGGRGG
jgi:hypothetical protein